MGKKKRNNKLATEDGKDERIAELFIAMQSKGAVWYRQEREGVAQIERFQSALMALREAQAAASNDKTENEIVLDGLAGNVDLDPWLAEDLYEQVQGLARGFKELLDAMYMLQAKAREMVLNASDDGQDFVSIKLRPIDYYQMMNQELATFEAEFQHIEILLRLVSFDTTTDELRTLVISWSTSPFLDPAQSRSFLQRHQISERNL